MHPSRVENAAKIDQAGAIEVQGFDRGSAGWRKTHDQRTVVIPGEMFPPQLLARMKQGDGFASNRIEAMGLAVLVTVASLARQSQVLQACRTILAAWLNVLNREGLHGEACLTATILATVSRPRSRSGPQ
jgi:hypothetical protein